MVGCGGAALGREGGVGDDEGGGGKRVREARVSFPAGWPRRLRLLAMTGRITLGGGLQRR